MTLNDLKDEMCALGFERDIDIDKNLIFAVKRALSTIYTERGVHNTFSIEHYPIMPTLICKSLTHVAGSHETLNLNGRAYTFTVSGTGSFIINEGTSRREYSFSSALYVWKGFISGEATVTFCGEFSFEVFNIAVFNSVRSNREEDLFPYGDPFIYKLSDMKSDFHSIVSLPTDRYGIQITDAIIRGDQLIIPWEYRGRINITYKVKAPEISPNNPNSEISLPKEIEHLIALLAAAYYWADDAPDKAEYYLALYKEGMNAVKKFDTRNLGTGYSNVTRWA